MKSCLYKVLSMSCMFGLLFGEAVARDNWSDNDRGRYMDAGSNENLNDNQYFPFKRSNGRMSDDKVIGVRILNNKIVFLGTNTDYYEENTDVKNVLSDPDYFSRYNNLYSIDLNNMELTGDMLRQLQMYLPKDITNFVVTSCSINKNDYLELASIITERPKINSIIIIDPYSALGESGKLLAAISNLKNLKYLSLTLGEVEVHGCDSLIEIMKKSQSSLEKLQLGFLKFDRSSLMKRENDKGELTVDSAYDEFQGALRGLKKLRSLEYSIIESDENQVGTFFTSLKDLRGLKNLKIYIADYNDHKEVKAYQNAETLSNALKGMSQLVSLDISHMQLPYAAFQVVCRSIGELSTLKLLNVSGNPIKDKSSGAFGEALRKLQHLNILVAMGCSIDSSGFSAINSGLSGASIQELYLGDNNIGSAITSLPLSSMKDLKCLDVAYNNIPLTDISRFWSNNETTKILQFINWRGNGIQGDSPKDENDRIQLRDTIKQVKSAKNISTIDLGL